MIRNITKTGRIQSLYNRGGVYGTKKQNNELKEAKKLYLR